MGFPQVTCPGILDVVERWDEIEVDWAAGAVRNLTQRPGAAASAAVARRPRDARGRRPRPVPEARMRAAADQRLQERSMRMTQPRPSLLAAAHRSPDGTTVWAAGAYDAMSALLIDRGLRRLLTSGFGVSASFLGQPDMELYTMTENLTVVDNITNVVRKPGLRRHRHRLRQRHQRDAHGARVREGRRRRGVIEDQVARSAARLRRRSRSTISRRRGDRARSRPRSTRGATPTC